MIRVEFCVDDASALPQADALGPDSLELCAALETGGITPSAGAMELARSTVAPVHVLVRSRPGGFVYMAEEIDQMTHDVAAVRARGLAGVVVGAATARGALDLGALRQFKAAAQGLDLTLHRCVDTLVDPVRGVEEAIGLGFRRVLTSGGGVTAADGIAVLTRMVEAAGSAIEIVAGAGLRVANVADVIRRSGVRSVHASCSEQLADPAGAGLFSSGQTSRFAPARAEAFLAAARQAID